MNLWNQMKALSTLAVFILLLCARAIAEISVKGGAAPNGRWKIVNAPVQSVVIEGGKGEVFGTIISDEVEARINGIECRWSADSSKVAVVVSYGVKLCALELYVRQKSGKFVKIEWKQPDLQRYFKDATDDFMPEYRLGNWSDSKVLPLIEGLVNSDARHALLRYEVTVTGKSATVGGIKRLGIFTDQAAEKVFQQLEGKPEVKTQGQSMPEMKRDAEAAFEKADAELNSVYRAVLAHLSAEKASALKKAQREWIVLRDKTAEEEASAEKGGSLEGLMYIQSQEATTQKRIKELRKMNASKPGK